MTYYILKKLYTPSVKTTGWYIAAEFDTRAEALECLERWDTVIYDNPDPGQGAKMISKGIRQAEHRVTRGGSELFLRAQKLTEQACFPTA